MSDKVYHKLAKVLDTLPNGFPATESGAEIKLLKKIFAPEEAELFCDLRLTFETTEQIAERTGRPIEGLDEMLITMVDKGQIRGTMRVVVGRSYRKTPVFSGTMTYLDFNPFWNI